MGTRIYLNQLIDEDTGQVRGFKDPRTGVETWLAAPAGPGSLPAYLRPTVLAEAITQELGRQTIQDAVWRARVSELMDAHPPIANVGTVHYIDLDAGTNGDGLSHTTPTNAQPTYAAGQTYLFAEGTELVATDGADGASAITFPAGTRPVFGTYDRTTGARVFDESRLATVNANGTGRVFGTNTALDSQAAVISGLRLKGARATTLARGIYIGKATAAATTSNWVIEHCVLEDILPTATDATKLGMAIECYADDAVIRFNKIRVTDCDGIYVGTAGNVGGRNTQVYGNDIDILSDTTDDGCDCIQFSNSGTGGLGSFHVHTNRLRNRVNAKQVVIVQDSAEVATTQGVIEHNFCVGADMTLPAIGTGGAGQKGIYVDAPRTTVRWNYTSGSAFPIFVGDRADCAVYENTAVLWGFAGAEVYRACVATYGDRTDVRDNALILDVPPGDTGHAYGVHEHGTTGSSVRRNTIVGRGIGLHVSEATVEQANTVWVDGMARETAVGGMHPGVAHALGDNSTSGVDPGLDADGLPVRRAVSRAPLSPYVFVGTWADLIAAYPPGGRALTSLPAGSKAWVTNWGVEFTPHPGRARWVAQEFTLASGVGAYSAPISTLSANGMFVQAPAPAHLLSIGSRILIEMRTKRTGTAATINQGIWLGTAGTTGDSRLLALAINATNNQEHRLPPVSATASAANTITTSDWLYEGQQATSVGADRTTNIAFDADMTLSIGISSITGPDTISLIEYTVRARV